MLLATSCIDNVFGFAVTTIFEFDGDILLGVGNGWIFPYIFAKDAGTKVGFLAGRLISF